MAVALDTQTLERVAQDGQMAYEKWPSILEPLLEALTNTAYSDFPTPRPYPTVNRPLVRPSSPSQNPNDSSITAPTAQQPTPQIHSPATRSLPPVPPFPGSAASTTSRITDSQPTESSPLPKPLLQLLEGILHNLRTSFSHYPPHTIQRLAELILYPHKHYQNLPAWLRATDRVISVSSTADIFPFTDQPALVNGINGDGILITSIERNGSTDLGSDESLGGALLTPIPWLRQQNASSISEDSANGEDDDLGDPIDTAAAAVAVSGNGNPLVPERQDGAVTQGELIRQEQEAGVVPVGPGGRDEHGRTMAHGVGQVSGGVEMDQEGENMPHARGPDVVGTVDMGLVDGREKEVNIGSPPSENDTNRGVDVNDAQEVLQGSGREVRPGPSNETGKAAESRGEMDLDDKSVEEARNMKESEQERPTESQDQDGDIVFVDADGNTDEDREKAEATGGNAGPGISEASTMT